MCQSFTYDERWRAPNSSTGYASFNGKPHSVFTSDVQHGKKCDKPSERIVWNECDAVTKVQLAHPVLYSLYSFPSFCWRADACAFLPFVFIASVEFCSTRNFSLARRPLCCVFLSNFLNVVFVSALPVTKSISCYLYRDGDMMIVILLDWHEQFKFRCPFALMHQPHDLEWINNIHSNTPHT